MKHIKGLPPNLLILLYLFLSALPICLAALQGLPVRSFSNEFASLLGLLGFTWMLLSFLLSGRFRMITGQIGIDKTMRLHQLMAIILGLFILLHPFLFNLPVNVFLPWDGTGQQSLTLTLPAFVSGMLAWLLLPVLIVTALYRDQFWCAYEGWRVFHGMLAILVVAASLHHVLEIGRYSQDILMRVFWFTLLGAAVLTLLRTYVVMPVLQKKRAFHVLSVEKAATKTWHITVVADEGTSFEFKAGQFAWLKLTNDSYDLKEHPFSISSAPSDLPKIRFTIKESGDFTNNIGEVVEGSRAYLDGPHGHFLTDDLDYRGIVMIAGGIGVAPMISMIRDMAYRKDARPITLLYGNRVESQIAFRDELESLTKELNLDVRFILSTPPEAWTGQRGRLDGSMIQGALDMSHPDQYLYLLCGPTGMLNSAVTALKHAGIPDQNILYEKFSYL